MASKSNYKKYGTKLGGYCCTRCDGPRKNWKPIRSKKQRQKLKSEAQNMILETIKWHK